MSFWITKKIRKGLAKKLRIALVEFVKDVDEKRKKEIQEILDQINETLNQPEFNKEDLPAILNGKLYRDDTIKYLIELMPFFDQQLLNSISTFFQTTIREFIDQSLPTYLIQHPDLINRIMDYFNNAFVSNTSHILFRACAKNRDFLKYLFDNGYVGLFIQYFTGNSFDTLSTAFATYESLLLTHPDITAENIESKWSIYQIQFKTLISSPNYLVQFTFLPILYRLITNDDCRLVFMKFLDDVENLQFIMMAMVSQSRKIQIHAYNVFKLFVKVPHKTEPIKNLLLINKEKILGFLQEIKFDENAQDLEDEKNSIIEIVYSLR